MKYWLKHEFKRILGVMLFITSIFLFFVPTNIAKILAVLAIVVSSKLMEDEFKNILQSLITGFIAIFYIVSAISWWFKTEVFILSYKFIVSDNQILVLVTILYVLLTYLILKNSRKQFDISRVPKVKVFVEDGCALNFRNESEDLIAKNLFVSVKIIYPIQRKFYKKLVSYFRVNFKQMIFKGEEIEAGGNMLLKIEDELLKRIPIEKNSYDKLIGKNSFEFEIKVSYTYETDTGYQIPEEINKVFRFGVKRNGIFLKPYRQNKFVRIR